MVNSQTNFDDVSMYLKFGHKSITLSKKFTLIFSYKGLSTKKCFSSSISPLEQFVHFLSDLIMFLYLPVSIFNEWALTLILHIDCRILRLLICKYFFSQNGSLCKSMYLIYLCCCQWHLLFLHSKNQENSYTYYLLLVYTTDLIWY